MNAEEGPRAHEVDFQNKSLVLVDIFSFFMMIGLNQGLMPLLVIRLEANMVSLSDCLAHCHGTVVKCVLLHVKIESITVSKTHFWCQLSRT